MLNYSRKVLMQYVLLIGNQQGQKSFTTQQQSAIILSITRDMIVKLKVSVQRYSS